MLGFPKENGGLMIFYWEKIGILPESVGFMLVSWTNEETWGLFTKKEMVDCAGGEKTIFHNLVCGCLIFVSHGMPGHRFSWNNLD